METTKTINQDIINDWASKRARPVEELAFKAGISPTTAKKLINGRYPKNSHPRFVCQLAVANVIGCEVLELFEYSEQVAA
ncbi:hypothetical protein [Kangiella sp.]|uniref:hypothetical protein n=1 Tax=Kangiella sp. TaxID=1920245 RepID=UPI003A90CA7B